MERSKGQAEAIVTILFATILIIIAIVGYSTMSRVYAGGLFSTVRNMTAVNETAKADTTIVNMENVWQYFLLLFIFFLILWIIAASQKKEPLAYYQG